jgi:hypothetical protein
LVLGRYDGLDRHWISNDRAVLVTRNGRLTRVVGLGHDLRETRGVEDDPVAAATFKFDGTHARSVDLGPDVYFGLVVESTFEVLGRQNVDIIGDVHETLVVREHNHAHALRWRFVNRFWFDFATGYVWRSVQHFSPDLPPVEIETFKRDA